MIYGHLSHLENITDETLKKALTSAIALQNAEVGRHDVDGDAMFASVSEYVTREDNDKYENHHDYIDVQILLSGEEIIRTARINEVTRATEYKPDCELFTATRMSASFTLGAGDFLILFPGEPHAPCIKAHATAEKVRKIVVKVHV